MRRRLSVKRLWSWKGVKTEGWDPAKGDGLGRSVFALVRFEEGALRRLFGRGDVILTLPRTVKVYVSLRPGSMHRSFDGLAGEVEGVFGQDPLTGHLFVFFNRRMDQVKVLYWDRSGFCV